MGGRKRGPDGKRRMKQLSVNLQALGLRVDSSLCLHGIDSLLALNGKLDFGIACVIRKLFLTPTTEPIDLRRCQQRRIIELRHLGPGPVVDFLVEHPVSRKRTFRLGMCASSPGHSGGKNENHSASAACAPSAPVHPFKYHTISLFHFNSLYHKPARSPRQSHRLNADEATDQSSPMRYGNSPRMTAGLSSIFIIAKSAELASLSEAPMCQAVLSTIRKRSCDFL